VLPLQPIEIILRFEADQIRKLAGSSRREVITKLLSTFPEIPSMFESSASNLVRRKGILVFRDLFMSDTLPREILSTWDTVLIPFRWERASFYLEISSYQSTTLLGDPVLKYRFGLVKKVKNSKTTNKNHPDYYHYKSKGSILLREKPLRELEFLGTVRLGGLTTSLVDMALAIYKSDELLVT
jgi:hypothetical protein